MQDLKDYLAKEGINPTENWYVSDIKKYFGIKGNKAKLVSQIEFIREALLLG